MFPLFVLCVSKLKNARLCNGYKFFLSFYRNKNQLKTSGRQNQNTSLKNKLVHYQTDYVKKMEDNLTSKGILPISQLPHTLLLPSFIFRGKTHLLLHNKAKKNKASFPL